MKCKNCGANLKITNGNYICEYCSATFLKEELLPQQPQQPQQPQGNGFRIVGGILLSYVGNQNEIRIPDGTYSIGKEAFKNNLTLKKVFFPKTVNSIDNNAFEGCANLTEICDYSNISKFGDECFKFSGLKNITIGCNVDFLGKGCFSRMPNLETVNYKPEKILKLNHTFAFCPKLCNVEEDVHNFFPSFHKSIELRYNHNNKRPTWGDAFVGTPYIIAIHNKYDELYKQGICPDCGGKINKGIFHKVCEKCGIDYNN